MRPEHKQPLIQLAFEGVVRVPRDGLHFWDEASETGETIECIVTNVVAERIVAEVRAPIWDEDRRRAAVYAAHVEAKKLDRTFRATVPLLAGAVNRIAFVVPSAGVVIGTRSVLGPTHPFVLNPLFAWLKDETVTDEELEAELQRIKELARKVSRDLGPCMEGPIVFDSDGPLTGPIDPHGDLTDPHNVRTRIPRDSYREALLSRKCAPNDEERERRTEDTTWQMLSQMLHEITHRCRFRSGAVGRKIGPEENAVTTELANRLITLLERLEPRLSPTPDGDTPAPLGDGVGLEGEDAHVWFRRLRRIVCRQICYRFEMVVPREDPWKQKYRNVGLRWQQFEAELQQIEADADATAEQKRSRARDALDRFKADTAQDRQSLESDFDVTWTFTFDENPLRARFFHDCTDRFGGRTIPGEVF